MSRRFDSTQIRDLLSRTEIRSEDFFAAMPGIPEQTVYSRIKSLVKSGVIHPIGHGVYSTRTTMVYTPFVSDWMIEVNHYLMEQMEGLSFCMQEAGGNLLVFVARSEILSVMMVLNKRYTQVFERSRVRAFEETLQHAVLVGAMVSESPVERVEGVSVPSLEKQLVDGLANVSDPQEQNRLFQRSFEVYGINRSKLLRYADRRHVGGMARSILEGLDTERIRLVSEIQTFLLSQPVRRAWLFGSFARREERPDSDIDILVDYLEPGKMSLMDIARISVGLEDVTRRKIDLIERKNLLPFAEPSANRDKYLIYERTA